VLITGLFQLNSRRVNAQTSEFSQGDGGEQSAKADLIPKQVEKFDFQEAEPESDWWSTMREQIASSEYYITWQERTYLEEHTAAYQAPNRAQNLRSYFTEDGLIVIPRIKPKGQDGISWQWNASPSSWGRGERLETLHRVEPLIHANRMEYHHSEALLEWYENNEDGIQHGFELTYAPESASMSPVQIILDVAGDLVGEQPSSDSGVEFLETNGSNGLNYSSPKAVDAKEVQLPAWLELQDQRLVLLVDDQQADYPVRVQVSITSISETADWDYIGPQGGAELGYHVATAGDVNWDGYSDVIVGAPYYDGGHTGEGLVRVFSGSANGVTNTILFDKVSNQEGANFGHAVSTAGDVNGDGHADIIVGAPYWDNGQEDEGAAWIYLGNPSGVTSAPDNYDEGNQAFAGFGASVGFAGDVNRDGYADVIVGAPLYANGQSEEGRVWVWHGSEDGISTASDWQAESNSALALFGSSVSTAGDVNGDGYADIIVGASGYHNGQDYEGKAFIWHGSESGVNEDTNGDPTNAEWDAELNAASARFGWSVSTAGDVNGDGYSDVIVGAPYHTNGQSLEGSAWLYLGSSTGVEDAPDNSDEGNQAGANFGISVATAGDVNGDGYADVIVGAPGMGTSGEAFVWYGHPGGISETRDWDDTGEVADDEFGASVATAGDVNGDGYSDIIVGAPAHSASAGKAYVYHGGPDGPEESATWDKRSNKEDALFGYSVSTAGDVNGDGYADVIVGAPSWDAGQAFEGMVFVYHGSADGLESPPAWNKQSDQEGARFGWSVSDAGDVNGDGYGDVLVGAPEWDDGQDGEGGAWVYRGSSSGLVGAPYWYKTSNQGDANFGHSVSGAGDVNGDGYADVLIGAPYYNHGQTNEGMVWVYHGSAAGVHDAPDWDFECDDGGAYLGYSVHSAGDVNRDGYSDVIVGAPLWHDDVVNEGRAWVFHGSMYGVEETHDWHAESNNFNGQLGYAVSTAGDVNGDGYADVIVGAPYYGGGDGRVWVFHGSSTGTLDTHNWTKTSGQSGANYGFSVSTAGDVNGDGYADVILGAPMMQDDIIDEGTARVYLGASGGLEDSPNWRGAGGQTLAWYGNSVSVAGDVNGDGYSEIIVGGHQFNSTYTNEGKAWVYYGNGGRGVALNPRQRGTDNSPVALLGRSNVPDRVRLRLLVQSPFGRGSFALETEIEPLGTQLIGDYSFSWGGPANYSIGHDTYISPFNLEGGTPHHWCLRWYYNPATTPWMPASRWVSLPYHGWNEAHFRTDFYWVHLPIVMSSP
jgi:hypothetical protein